MEKMILTNEERMLFVLLRAGLQTEPPQECAAAVALPVDWEAVYRMAHVQGVLAVAWDGLQALTKQDGALPADSRPPRELLLRWFGNAARIAGEYGRQWEVAADLAGKFGREGIRTIVLKGFSAARRYPVPSHRPCGDLDCYLSGDYERGNCVAERAGAVVHRDYYKHSHLIYRGLMVENHQFLTAVRGSRKARHLERLLQAALAERPLPPLGQTALEATPPFFDALFLTVHAWTHFLLEEGITLRHLCDWAMLWRCHERELDRAELRRILAERDRGMLAFAESMTALARRYLHVPVAGRDVLPEDGRLLRDMLSPASPPAPDKENGRRWPGVPFGVRYRWQLVRTLVRNRWKFRRYSERSLSGHLFRAVLAFVFERVPRL